MELAKTGARMSAMATYHLCVATPSRSDTSMHVLRNACQEEMKNLGCWPPFPLVVDYFTWNGTARAPNYKGDLIAALEYPDRIRSIKLAVTPSLMVPVASVMQEPFLTLTYLRLSSEDRDAPALPAVMLSWVALPQVYRKSTLWASRY